MERKLPVPLSCFAERTELWQYPSYMSISEGQLGQRARLRLQATN
jgi:hypothetical protein